MKNKIINILFFFNRFFFTDLNDAYDKCNWKVKILTQTAVSDHDGITNFYSDHDNANLEWGGTVFGNDLFEIQFMSNTPLKSRYSKSSPNAHFGT